jgi:hypothetical protein
MTQHDAARRLLHRSNLTSAAAAAAAAAAVAARAAVANPAAAEKHTVDSEDSSAAGPSVFGFYDTTLPTAHGVKYGRRTQGSVGFDKCFDRSQPSMASDTPNNTPAESQVQGVQSLPPLPAWQ